MLPVLKPDDHVFMDPRSAVRVGDIVVSRHPLTRDVHVVKRLASIDEAGRARLEGLNAAESTDSRTLGTVPMALILGRVTSRF